jgi:hypothetical protein
MSVKIINGRRGYILTIDGMYINHGFEGIKAIENSVGIPHGATEWVSIQAVRNIWNLCRPLIVGSVKRPYKSVWGRLELKTSKK